MIEPRSVASSKPKLVGGRSAINGFLFQIARSLRLGIRGSISFASAAADQMQLILEPEDGGDHRLVMGNEQHVEQVKWKSPGRSWSSPEIAREVIPDLLRAVRSGVGQRFSFVTNNGAGLTVFRTFLATRNTSAVDPGAGLRWNRKRVSAAEFQSLIASEAGVAPEEPRLAQLLDRLDIEIVDTSNADGDLHRLIGPLLAPGESAAAKRMELTTMLLKAAAEGRALSAGQLINAISDQAFVRIALVHTLPGALRHQIEYCSQHLGYIPSQQARRTPPPLTQDVTVLTGESGQGKTWSLCQAALAELDADRLALLMPQPSSLENLIAFINEQVWQPAYPHAASLRTIHQRLGPYFSPAGGFWLTLFVDDVQDRALASRIGQYDWRSVGIRLVLSCQPRIAWKFEQRRAAEIQQVGDFSSSELRRFLSSQARQDPLETMPDDVFELLLKPIHARVYCRLPAAKHWVATNEYELFKAYWIEASLIARDQPDHRTDVLSLLDLARLLLAERPVYPWRLAQVRSTGITDDALVRLEQVGLLRWDGPGELQFSSDRMLNWAVAEAVAALVEEEQLDGAQAAAALARIEELTTRQGEPLGYRLGYVLMDLLWLLCCAGAYVHVADLLLFRALEQGSAWRDRGLWQEQLPTLGAAVLPALRLLALRDHGDDHELPHAVASALTTVAESDGTAADPLVRELAASGAHSAPEIAISVASCVACPGSIEEIWSLLRQREHAYRQRTGDAATSSSGARVFEARNRAAAALNLAASRRPQWLEDQLNENTDGDELELLLTALTNAPLPEGVAQHLWERHKAKFRASLPADSYALAGAIGHFRDETMADWLEAVPYDPHKFTTARVMHSRARVDPSGALQQIASGGDRYDRLFADWWVEDLARRDREALAEAIRAHAQESDKPLLKTVLHYRNHPDAITPQTLDWILDEFARGLHDLSEETAGDGDERLGSLGHALSFLARLAEPWQFDLLARRAGTPFEEELARWAGGRRGRTSRYRDHDGAQCERLLAVIGARGFDSLVFAELRRPDPFGREDGFELACWCESVDIRSALIDAAEDSTVDSYRQVIAMEAFAVHQCDAELETMIRRGSPVYVNAALIRGESGRPAQPLLRRVEALVVDGDWLVAAKLGGFLPDGYAPILLPIFLSARAGEVTKRAIVGTFRYAGFYDPAMLNAAAQLLEGSDNDAHFAALYLAENGDAEARLRVIRWMESRDLGNGTVGDHAYLRALARHADSRPAVVALLLRSRSNGHLLHESWQLELLADAGDSEARQRLNRSSYRQTEFGEGSRLAGIAYVRRADTDEAFFCARRMWAIERSAAAIDFLLDIDPANAVPLLIADYVEVKPSLRVEIARRLRVKVPAGAAAEAERFSCSTRGLERQRAAELAGWLPLSFPLGWLEPLADDADEGVRDAARRALRRRQREEAALEHLRLMSRSSKPQRWARMQALFELVDPYLLWRRDDPLSLGVFLDEQPHEFFVEAEKLQRASERDLAQKLKRADDEDDR